MLPAQWPPPLAASCNPVLAVIAAARRGAARNESSIGMVAVFGLRLYLRHRIDREVVSGETPRNRGTPSGKFFELSSMTLQDIELLAHDEHIVRTIFNALQAA